HRVRLQDGTERNTRYLEERHGWRGLLLDGGFANPAVNLHQVFIKPGNIRSIFTKHRVPSHFDLLSIDIDSYDLWVWRKLCAGRSAYRPRVVVIEFDRNFDLAEYWAFPTRGGILRSINAFFLRDDIFSTLPPHHQRQLTLPSLHPGARAMFQHAGPQLLRLRVDYREWSIRHNLTLPPHLPRRPSLPRRAILFTR
ncbi:MAG: hypothetical protein SGPRY_011480, partial [Prymnesium sp.]